MGMQYIVLRCLLLFWASPAGPCAGLAWLPVQPLLGRQDWQFYLCKQVTGSLPLQGGQSPYIFAVTRLSAVICLSVVRLLTYLRVSDREGGACPDG